MTSGVNPGGDKEGRGRFTRMFDREFIADVLERKQQEALDEAELATTERKKRESRRHEVALSMANHFSTRNAHLQRRFPGMQIDSTSDDLTQRMVFPPSAASPEGACLEFQIEVSHQGASFHVHSRTTLEGRTTADRVSFSEKNVDYDRLDRFIERKLLDFVRRYLGEVETAG